MNANKAQFRTSFLKTKRWIQGAAATFALAMSAGMCFASAHPGQQPSAGVSSQQISNPATPGAIPPGAVPDAAPQHPQQSSTAAPNASPSPTPGLVPASTGPGFVFPQLNDREIVVTAVGDVMLGTTFPDETGG